MSATGDATVISVDIGGGSVKLAWVAHSGEVLRADTVEDVPAFGSDALLAEIGQRAQALAAPSARRSLAGLAIGVPGHLSPDRRASLNSNVPMLDGVDLVGTFERRLGCAVRLENDANLAALGEWAFGPWRAATRFMMVTLGTGIGVALLDDGKPVDLVGGTLGDAGHIVVDPGGGRSCRLGCRGCLESVASGVAIAEIAAETGARDPDSPLGKLRRGGQAITGADLARLAAGGDAATLSILARAGTFLGQGLASYINVFAPDVICIGGGASRLRPFLEAPLNEAAERGRIKNRRPPEAIYFSDVYDAAAGRGAVALFLPGARAKG